MKSCFMFGHADCPDTMLPKIEEAIVKCYSKEVTAFYVGSRGRFDSLAASAVKQVKQQHPDIKLYLTIPYLTTEINENPEEYYKRFDGIQLANIPESTPKKLMIIKCNQFMIDSSSFLVSFVEHSWGGAYRTLQYAKGKDIKIINLSKSN